MHYMVTTGALAVFLWSGALAGEALVRSPGDGNVSVAERAAESQEALAKTQEDVDHLVGTWVKAVTAVPVREDPPNGFLLLPGKKLQLLKPGTKYQIAEVAVRPYVFSTQTWVRVSSPDSEKDLGWSYFGENPVWLDSKNFALVHSGR